MFTLEQINDIHARVGKAATFPEYVSALNALGVEKCDSYLTDGHSEYFGKNGERVDSLPVHEELIIAGRSNRESFLDHLKLHEQGGTSYLEMSRGLAESGIEKWTIDTVEMTMIYLDQSGNELLVERIE
jgi:uncharacterized protein YbcV (DUF1398 family)